MVEEKKFALPPMPLPPLPVPTPEFAEAATAGVEPLTSAVGVMLRAPVDIVSGVIGGLGTAAESLRATVETVLKAPLAAFETFTKSISPPAEEKKPTAVPKEVVPAVPTEVAKFTID